MKGQAATASPHAATRDRRVIVLAEFGRSGGTRTFFLGLLSVLARIGVRPHVLISADQLEPEIHSWLDRPGIDYQIVPTCPGVAAKLHGRFPLGPLYDSMVRALYWREHRDAPLLITTGSPGRWLGLFRSASRGLYILHTIPAKRLDSFSRRLIVRRLGSSHRLLTVSRFAATEMRQHWLGLPDGASPAQIAVVHNCGDLGDQAVPTRRLETPRRVLTLGHVTSYKNPESWIDVAEAVVARYPAGAVEFVWAGEGPLLDRCRREVARRNLANVSFIGLQRDISGLFATCWAYFQWSTIENHCISILTAMQTSVPCVVSPAGGSAESVTDGETGFVVPLTENHRCVEALVQLLDDRALNERMGAAGRRRYCSLFTQQRWTAQMERELRAWLS